MKIAHGSLRRFHERGDASQLRPAWMPRIRHILTLLERATEPRHLAVPGFELHPLKGRFHDYWSVSVAGNWRIVFRFEGGEAVAVRLIDHDWLGTLR